MHVESVGREFISRNAIDPGKRALLALKPNPGPWLRPIWRAEICTQVGRKINRNPMEKFSTISVLLYRT